jgi:hypothetical protein
MKNQTLAIVIILLLLVWGAWYYLNKPKQESVLDDSSISTGMRIERDTVYVADQKPGSSATVSLAGIIGGGYVVIHEVTDGNPGAIIGNSSLLPTGESGNVVVNLSRETKEGEELIAMLHNDNGDSVFNAVNDAPVQDKEGNIILMRFIIREGAEAPDAVSL